MMKVQNILDLILLDLLHKHKVATKVFLQVAWHETKTYTIEKLNLCKHKYNFFFSFPNFSYLKSYERGQLPWMPRQLI